MAKRFNTNVAVHRDPSGTDTVWFHEGDEVPAWAEDLVGSHVYGEAEEIDDVRLTDPALEDDDPAVRFSTPTIMPTTGVVEAEDEEEEDDLDTMTKSELQDIAAELGVATSGNKDELKARIREAQEANEDNDEDEE